MARRSLGRDLHHSRIDLNTNTPQEYIDALKVSPYRTHQRAGKGLVATHENLVGIEARNQEREEFAKSLGVSL